MTPDHSNVNPYITCINGHPSPSPMMHIYSNNYINIIAVTHKLNTVLNT